MRGILPIAVPTRVVVFPFDLFGAGGCAAGAELLADELREVLADNRRETVETRADAYTPHVRLRQVAFETMEKYQSWREQGQRLARQALDDGEFLVWITGNHLGCLPVYDVLSNLDDPPLVVQLDAHLDVHHFADCTAEPSHGNFLLHCENDLPPLINVGHRELLLTPHYIDRYYRAAHPASRFAVDPAGVLKAVRGAADEATGVVLDLDCDVLDPSAFPAVARPVPFGLSSQQVLALVEAAWSRKVRAVLLSEFDPARDENDRSLSMLMWLLEYLLIRRYEKG